MTNQTAKKYTIGVTGANGFVGSAFTKLAQAAGHTVVGYSRTPRPGQRVLNEMDFRGLDAVVHLAGEPVLGIWTKRKMQAILESRAATTQMLVQALQALPEDERPALIMASGASYYGDSGDKWLREDSGPGVGFLPKVTVAWESAGFRYSEEVAGRVVALRLPLVLGKESAAWPLMSRFFKLGLGGRLGSGKQWWPWIHINDVARALLYAVEQPTLNGVYNAGAPEVVTNAEFTRQLAQKVGRWAVFTTPAFLLRLLPGGMASVFLDSLRLSSAKLEEAGFTFQYSRLDAAFDALLKK